MNIFVILREAMQALKANKLRSLLTIFGVVVGIFAVTAMLALGEGLTENIVGRFNSFAAGDITVVGDLSQRDINWVEDQSYVEGVLAQQSASDVKTTAMAEGFSPSIDVYLGDYVNIKGREVLSGELFDMTDVGFDEFVVIANEGFVEAVKAETGSIENPESVILNGQRFEIVAVVEGGTSRFGRGSDGTLIVPYASALGIVTNTKMFSSVGISLRDSAYYEIAGQHILESLNVSRFAPKDSDDYFMVNSAQDIIENALETSKTLSIFLGIIGAITLFVGGIGTMNMMLTTVTERTKEIGLRKAIGARNKDILYQVLAESVVLTGFGGVIGVAITYVGSILANRLLEGNSFISVVVSWGVVGNAILVAFLVGIIFGFYPARSASRLQPVDALRAD